MSRRKTAQKTKCNDAKWDDAKWDDAHTEERFLPTTGRDRQKGHEAIIRDTLLRLIRSVRAAHTDVPKYAKTADNGGGKPFLKALGATGQKEKESVLSESLLRLIRLIAHGPNSDGHTDSKKGKRKVVMLGGCGGCGNCDECRRKCFPKPYFVANFAALFLCTGPASLQLPNGVRAKVHCRGVATIFLTFAVRTNSSLTSGSGAFVVEVQILRDGINISHGSQPVLRLPDANFDASIGQTLFTIPFILADPTVREGCHNYDAVITNLSAVPIDIVWNHAVDRATAILRLREGIELHLSLHPYLGGQLQPELVDWTFFFTLGRCILCDNPGMIQSVLVIKYSWLSYPHTLRWWHHMTYLSFRLSPSLRRALIQEAKSVPEPQFECMLSCFTAPSPPNPQDTELAREGENKYSSGREMKVPTSFDTSGEAEVKRTEPIEADENHSSSCPSPIVAPGVAEAKVTKAHAAPDANKAVAMTPHHLTVLSLRPNRRVRLSVHVGKPYQRGDLIFTEHSDLTGETVIDCAQQLLDRPWRFFLEPREDRKLNYANIDPACLAQAASVSAKHNLHATPLALRGRESICITASVVRAMKRVEEAACRGHNTPPLCLFPFASLMHPRVVPNVFRVIDLWEKRARLRVYALRDVPKGEEIGCAYLKPPDEKKKYTPLLCECSGCQGAKSAVADLSIFGENQDKPVLKKKPANVCAEHILHPTTRKAKPEKKLSLEEADMGEKFRHALAVGEFQSILHQCVTLYDPTHLFVREALEALSRITSTLVSVK